MVFKNKIAVIQDHILLEEDGDENSFLVIYNKNETKPTFIKI